MTAVQWLTWFAYYFILWWIVLFAVLPFSARTQEDEGEVTLGTEPSASSAAHVRRAIVRTTIVSAVIFLAYLMLSAGFGWSIDDIPRIVPNYS